MRVDRDPLALGVGGIVRVVVLRGAPSGAPVALSRPIMSSCSARARGPRTRRGCGRCAPPGRCRPRPRPARRARPHDPVHETHVGRLGVGGPSLKPSRLRGAPGSPETGRKPSIFQRGASRPGSHDEVRAAPVEVVQSLFTHSARGARRRGTRGRRARRWERWASAAARAASARPGRSASRTARRRRRRW